MDQGKNTPLSKSEWKRYRPIEKGIRCSSLSTFPSSSRNLSGLNSSPFSQWLPCSHFVNDLAGCDKVNWVPIINGDLEDFSKERKDHCIFWKDHSGHRNVPERLIRCKNASGCTLWLCGTSLLAQCCLSSAPPSMLPLIETCWWLSFEGCLSRPLCTGVEVCLASWGGGLDQAHCQAPPEPSSVGAKFSLTSIILKLHYWQISEIPPKDQIFNRDA